MNKIKILLINFLILGLSNILAMQSELASEPTIVVKKIISAPKCFILDPLGTNDQTLRNNVKVLDFSCLDAVFRETITDERILIYLQLCPTIEEINVEGCLNLTKIVIDIIEQNCKNLKRLTITCGSGLSGHYLKAAVRSFAKKHQECIVLTTTPFWGADHS